MAASGNSVGGTIRLRNVDERAVTLDNAQELKVTIRSPSMVRDTASIAPPAAPVHRSSMVTGPPPPVHAPVSHESCAKEARTGGLV